jgi:hypothetical protein
VSRHEPLKDTMNRAVYERSMVHASFTPLNLASRTRRDLTGRANYSHELPYPWKIVRTSPGLPTPWAGPRFLRTRFAQLSPTSSKRVPGFPASLSVPRSSLLGRMDGRIADLSAYGMIGAPQAWIPPRPPLKRAPITGQGRGPLPPWRPGPFGSNRVVRAQKCRESGKCMLLRLSFPSS